MRIHLLILLLTILCHSSFACSCLFIEDPCDNINNEYRIPVLVSFKNLSAQEGVLKIENVYSEGIILDEEYVIIADSFTSCSTSLDNIEEGQLYYFGFPKHAITSDTIGYSQCMSPFYDEQKFWYLDKCSSKIRIEYIDVYPNPIVDNQILIRSSHRYLIKMQLFRTNGQLVYKQEIDQIQTNRYSIPKNIFPGIYFLIFTDINGFRFMSKVLVS